VMAEYNQEQEEDAYVLNVEQFVRSGLGSSQIANLFSLGAIPATEEDKSASSADEESNPSATSKKKAAPEPAQARAGASVPSEAQVPSSRGPKLAGEEVTKKRSNSASEHALVEKRAGTAGTVLLSQWDTGRNGRTNDFPSQNNSRCGRREGNTGADECTTRCACESPPIGAS